MMVDCQLRTYDVTDQVVLAAADAVPREIFVPLDRRSVCYADQSLMIAAASPDAGPRYLLAPMVVARMLQALQIKPGDEVLDYAGGTGYSAALAAHMGAKVTMWEPNETLAGQATEPLRAAGAAVTVVSRKPVGSFDAILVNGRCERQPTELFDLLKIGGRLAVIEGGARGARVILYQRYGDGVSGRQVFDAAAQALDEYRASESFAF